MKKLHYFYVLSVFLFITFNVNGQEIKRVGMMGDTIVFSLTSNTSGAIQWQVKESLLMPWSNIWLADSSTFILTTSNETAGLKYYRAKITDTSEFIYPPFYQDIQPGGPAKESGVYLYLNLNGNYPSIQWQTKIDSLTLWSDIPDATFSSFWLLTDSSYLQNRVFRVKCGNPNFNCVSSSLRIRLNLLDKKSDLQIGDFYGGGFIFHLDTNNNLALVVPKSYQGHHIWGCAGTLIDGADSSSIGSGAQNTIDILNGCLVDNIAAAICDTLFLNGYDNWHLPSKDEMWLIKANLFQLGLLDVNWGWGYWTSTEVSEDAAWRYAPLGDYFWAEWKHESNAVLAAGQTHFFRKQYITTPLLTNQSITAYLTVEPSNTNPTDVIINFTEYDSTLTTFNWDFSGGLIISGYGTGPYTIRYADGNYRKVSLNLSQGTCNSPTFYSSEFKVSLFDRLNNILPPYVYGNSEWGDYNNDGLLDILTTGEGQTKIIKNFGNDTFAEINSNFPELWYSNCKWFDYNNDGRLDFLVSGLDSLNLLTKLYENQGNNIFIETGQYFPGVRLGALACFDYNNDGLTDIIISGEDSLGFPLTSLFKNSVDFIFKEDSLNIKQLQYSAIDFADYNKDGYIDFLISGRDSTGPYTLLYKNLNGLFVEIPTSIINTWSGDIAWGDYNNDGFPDVAISGYKQEPIINGSCINRSDAVTFKVYRNNGNEIFTEVFSMSGTRAFFNSEINWGDINNDGAIDLLSTGFAGNNSCYAGIGGGGSTITDIYFGGRSAGFIYKNIGGDNFTDMCANIPRAYYMDPWGGWGFYLPAPDRGCYSLSISPGDFNNDGKLDILKGGSGNVPSENLYFNSAIYKNLIEEVNLPPGMSDNLSTILIGDTIIFGWQPALDIQTPQAGLSYNLRVGTSPGGSEIISAMSDSTGWRKVVATGNMGQNIQGKLWGLAPGTYYWSVQAIDNSFAGGPFAEEQSFIVEDYTLKRISAKVFLEGAYNPGSMAMNNALVAKDLIPEFQPYGTGPWNYNGEETVTSMPEGIIDWVLVELRQAASAELATEATIIEGWPKALLLKADGSIVGLDNKNPLIGEASITENLYIVIRHRNHLDVMSSAPLSFSGNTYSYDFTDAVTKAYGGAAGYKQIGTGVFGMVAGDIDADGAVFASDFNLWAINFGLTTVYLPADVDMDGQVFASDFNKWAVNFGTNTITNKSGKITFKSQVP